VYGVPVPHKKEKFVNSIKRTKRALIVGREHQITQATQTTQATAKENSDRQHQQQQTTNNNDNNPKASLNAGWVKWGE